MEDDDALLAWFADFADRGGTPALSAEEARAVLDLARVVAHTAERRYAPLAAYLAGRAGYGADQLRELVEVVRDRA